MRILIYTLLLVSLSTRMLAGNTVSKDTLKLPVDINIQDLRISVNAEDSTLDLYFLVKPLFNKLNPNEFIKISPVVRDYNGDEQYYSSVRYEGVDKRIIRERTHDYSIIAKKQTIYNQRGVEYKFSQHLPLKKWNTGVVLSVDIIYIKGSEVAYKECFHLAEMPSIGTTKVVYHIQAPININSLKRNNISRTQRLKELETEEFCNAVFNYKGKSRKADLRDTANTHSLLQLKEIQSFFRRYRKDSIKSCQLFVLGYTAQSGDTAKATSLAKDIESVLVNTCSYNRKEYHRTRITNIFADSKGENQCRVLSIYFDKFDEDVERFSELRLYHEAKDALMQWDSSGFRDNRIGVVYMAEGDFATAKKWFLKAESQSSRAAELNLKLLTTMKL